MVSKHAGAGVRTVLTYRNTSIGGAEMTIMTTADCRSAAYAASRDHRPRPAYFRGIPGCVWQLAVHGRPRWGRRTET
jgi:hypothetical protein